MTKTLTRLTLAFAAVFCFAWTPVFAQSATPGPTPTGSVGVQLPAERADAATLVGQSHSTGGTITLTVGSAGSTTQFAYITGIDVQVCQGSAVTAAAPTFITSTGFSGTNPQYMVGSGPATAGTCNPTDHIAFSAPLRSATGGTSPVFTLPAFITNQTVNVNIYYKLGAQ